MRFTREYFREYAEAMDEVETVMDIECPFDEKTRRLIAFALAIKDRNETAVKAQFNAALKVGVKFKDLAYVASMVEFEATRFGNTWLHEALGDGHSSPVMTTIPVAHAEWYGSTDRGQESVYLPCGCARVI